MNHGIDFVSERLRLWFNPNKLLSLIIGLIRPKTSLDRKRVVGIIIVSILFALFLAFSRLPKLDTIQHDLDIVTNPDLAEQCFQGFCIDIESESSLLSSWWDFSFSYMKLITTGMLFAFIIAGAVETFFFPGQRYSAFSNKGLLGATKGLILGSSLNLCSACITPITNAFRRKGAGIEATIGILQGSATMNPLALIMVFMVFSPLLASTRVGISLIAALTIGPLAAFLAREKLDVIEDDVAEYTESNCELQSWKNDLRDGLKDWMFASLRYFIRLGPVMIIAGFFSGLMIQWISPDVVAKFLGNHIWGVLIAAILGLLINVPLLFEIPLVVLLMLLGMGPAPAAAFLLTAAGAGPITFWGMWKLLPKKALATLAVSTFIFGMIAGLGVFTLNEELQIGNSFSKLRPLMITKRVEAAPQIDSINVRFNIPEEPLYDADHKIKLLRDQLASAKSKGPASAVVPVGFKQYNSPPYFGDIFDPDIRNTAILELETGEKIVILLYARFAMHTVNNFQFLAREGFYDGVTFHRVVPGFMAQTGDPSGSGSGGPGYKIDDEFHPKLRHNGPGIVSMVNEGEPNTNGSQFFITYDDLPHLDGLHTVFGKVILGMEILEGLPARNPINAHESGLLIKKVVLSDFPRMGPFP